MQLEQAKIDKLTNNLEKVERLLEKLLSKKGYDFGGHDYSARGHIDKSRLKIDMDKL